MDDLGSPKGTGRVESGTKESAEFACGGSAELFRAVPGAVFRRRPPDWLGAPLGAQASVPPVLHGGAGEGLRPFEPGKRDRGDSQSVAGTLQPALGVGRMDQRIPSGSRLTTT